MKRRTYLAGTLTVAARLAIPGGLTALAGCGSPGMREAPTRFAGPTMGTTYRISLAERLSQEEIDTVRAGVEAALHRVDGLMSTYKPGSELSRFNASTPGDWTPVAPDTAAVVAEALQAASVSEGAFDVTLGPLVDLWGFGPGEARGVPSDEAIADALASSGLEDLRFDPARRAVMKSRKGLRVDLSGVAKGHAVDLVADRLDAEGFASYLVDVGGELRARGRKAGGAPWRVGIERPIPGARQVQRVVTLDGEAVATSGDYRNFFEHGGRRYSHTIDPRTGRPVEHALASVSVLADRAVTGDALSTAMMVMGPDEGLGLAERLDIPALFLIRSQDGVVERATSNFLSRIVT